MRSMRERGKIRKKDTSVTQSRIVTVAKSRSEVTHSQIQHYTRPYCVFKEIIQSWLLLRKCVSGVSNEWWTSAAGGKYMIRNGIVSNSKLHESRDQSTIDLPIAAWTGPDLKRSSLSMKTCCTSSTGNTSVIEPSPVASFCRAGAIHNASP